MSSPSTSSAIPWPRRCRSSSNPTSEADRLDSSHRRIGPGNRTGNRPEDRPGGKEYRYDGSADRHHRSRGRLVDRPWKRIVLEIAHRWEIGPGEDPGVRRLRLFEPDRGGDLRLQTGGLYSPLRYSEDVEGHPVRLRGGQDGGGRRRPSALRGRAIPDRNRDRNGPRGDGRL